MPSLEMGGASLQISTLILQCSLDCLLFPYDLHFFLIGLDKTEKTFIVSCPLIPHRRRYFPNSRLPTLIAPPVLGLATSVRDQSQEWKSKQ